MPFRARTACLLFWLASGCVDAGARFDAFNDRLEDKRRLDEERQQEDAKPMDDCIAPTVEQLEGRYLFSVAVSIDPTKPIVASLVLTKLDGQDNKMLATYDVLSADEERVATAKFSEAEATLDGNVLSITQVDITVVGVANPLQPGLQAEAAISSQARVCAMGAEPVAFICGDTKGEITKPLTISIEGSTFGAVRVAEGEPWPSPVASCEEGTETP